MKEEQRRLLSRSRADMWGRRVHDGVDEAGRWWARRSTHSGAGGGTAVAGGFVLLVLLAVGLTRMIDGRAPSEPAAPPTYRAASAGETIRPAPLTVRIIDTETGEEVLVPLPPGSTVIAGEVVPNGSTRTTRPGGTATNGPGTGTTGTTSHGTSTTGNPTTSTSPPTTQDTPPPPKPRPRPRSAPPRPSRPPRPCRPPRRRTPCLRPPRPRGSLGKSVGRGQSFVGAARRTGPQSSLATDPAAPQAACKQLTRPSSIRTTAPGVDRPTSLTSRCCRYLATRAATTTLSRSASCWCRPRPSSWSPGPCPRRSTARGTTGPTCCDDPLNLRSTLPSHAARRRQSLGCQPTPVPCLTPERP